MSKDQVARGDVTRLVPRGQELPHVTALDLQEKDARRRGDLRRLEDDRLSVGQEVRPARGYAIRLEQ